MLLYYLDLAGVAVFAASGVIAARDRGLDMFGLLVVAAVTAIGGGTLRDVLLDRHPIFWISDSWYAIVIIVAALLTVAYLRVWPAPRMPLLVADALGLGLFALSGAQVAEAAQCPPLIVVLLGTMTGVTGGVLRDVLTAQVPLILRREIYATAAVAGIAVYLGLGTFGVAQPIALGVGMFVVVVLRLLAVRRDLHLPAFGRA
ncbi:trimeric intracellular cation channel family protein [Chloroflexus sp.]|uniref:trimeric intracellular cation channel family protein n=1 Tax=Chloroflexus sp. TaxID=1904827 RepID=UPI00298F0C5B|nr:trimeric intracellular cation channel family protein [Chloroflexus sp.]MCX7860130.1 trimeric intracellular cation channel family protein [Chloroflexus sp.]MDW8405171.1 trimeric intracellular cation channel family protein [Chloroflexus sp.]